MDITDELKEAADLYDTEIGIDEIGELELRAIAEIRSLRADLAKVTVERDEAIHQLTQRLKQSHELRRALDALELHAIPELQAEIERLQAGIKSL